MNREEILARNRKENEGREDERELQVFADASKLGMAIVGIVAGTACVVGMVIMGLQK